MIDIGHILRVATGPTGRHRGDETALSLENDESWSWDQLAQRVSRLANGLLDLGVVKGDRIGLLLYNALDYAALYLAITRIGAVVVRLNWRLAPEELDYAINDSGCRIVCVHDSLVEQVAAIRGRLSAERIVVVDDVAGEAAGGVAGRGVQPGWAMRLDTVLQAEAGEPPCPPPSPEDLAMIMYTSGTTGRPKGAMWTHANTITVAAMQAMQWQYCSDTVAMTTGPMYHVAAWEDLVLPALLLGGRGVVSRSAGFDLARVLRTAAAQRVTDLFLFPAMVAELPSVPEARELDLSCLRRIICAGTTVTPRIVRDFRAVLPHVALAVGYGLTEGGAVVSVLSDAEAETHSDTAGRPFPLVEVRIAGTDGIECPHGTDGEIWVRSPAVSPGYWQRPDADRETFVDGWCRTGDQGRITAGGLVKITGRFKDMIRTGGENVYPAEVESVLADHPAVADIAVIGVPDPVYDEAVCAVVVARDDLQAEELVRYSRSRLAGYKRPRHVFFTDQLPRNPSGKVLKYQLRDQYGPLARRDR
ncbi:fatty acid--CoA ligase [Amycolatopsis ultiminotia]|uniref:Fatty acid--CoA ligase n=1 Tax=Amycolatopsis ultiminotia TaxID=543629 RepID=A0ABP6X4S0_9PSEU